MKEVTIVLKKEQEEVIKNYPFKTESFDENNKVDITIAIHRILNDYNNLVDIAEKELVSVFNNDEMNQLCNASENIVYTGEIPAKKFLYDSVVDSEIVSADVIDKITKLSNTQAYVVLRKIANFWE
ncbi:hypothetical protein HBE96_23095 [Clostridium sp. P21]|uniref:Uncharacterized protein n=1 Tax=Clostridium muellerianum TaxID=2716538 RepID=A0A7Y0EL33_9CLOT|nr:hypothetical protein [Clostridium muellerianum]NMM65468.1 hypothetical protein [Clostridium muellerianum]